MKSKKLATILAATSLVAGLGTMAISLKAMHRMAITEPQREFYSENSERFQNSNLYFNDYDNDGLVDTIDYVDPRQTVLVAEGFTNRHEIFPGFKEIKTMPAEMRKAASDYMKSIADFRYSLDKFNYEQKQTKIKNSVDSSAAIAAAAAAAAGAGQ